MPEKLAHLAFDMAKIYQKKALDSMDRNDLAHAKRYREMGSAIFGLIKQLSEIKGFSETDQITETEDPDIRAEVLAAFGLKDNKKTFTPL